MKYIDAARLKAEIEFAKSVYDNPKRVVHGVADAFMQDGRAAMCDDILKKIDSLQQEQPKVDLEKEYTKYVVEDPVYSKLVNDIVGKAIACHFYELGKQERRNNMAAPDKIYLSIQDVGSGYVYNISHDNNGEQEYLRKDALMEWAKEHQEGERQGSYTWSCYQIFIDKLNEM